MLSEIPSDCDLGTDYKKCKDSDAHDRMVMFEQGDE
jgi:hypothetical protein